MDDSQANNDNLEERLKNRAQEHARGKQAKTDQQSFRERANTFISDHAREEYDNLIRFLNERVEERNANVGNLPKFVIRGSSVQLGHMALCLEFDQLIMNPADYVLVLKVGLAPFKKPLFGREPTPERYKLRATTSDDLRSILW